MAKHKIIAARKLQVIGHDGDVEAGTELATIETECELSSLVSLLHFGSAIVEPVVEAPKMTPRKPQRRSLRDARQPLLPHLHPQAMAAPRVTSQHVDDVSRRQTSDVRLQS